MTPEGFIVAQFTTLMHAMTGQDAGGYTIRPGVYDLRKLRGKHLLVRPGQTRRCQVPEDAARALAALPTVRDQIASILGGIRVPRQERTRGQPDQSRPRLRNPPRRRATPLSRPRHLHRHAHRGMNNILSIRPGNV